MSEFLNKNKIRFVDLTGEQMKLLVANIDRVEEYDSIRDRWDHVEDVALFPHLYDIYRVRPEPKTKPQVDWSWFEDHIVAVTRNFDGLLCCHDTMPIRSSSKWVSDDTAYDVSALKIDPGTCDWRDSLVFRPDTWIKWDGRAYWPGDPETIVEVFTDTPQNVYSTPRSVYGRASEIEWEFVTKFKVVDDEKM